MLNKKKIIITGANGVIGQILQKGLKDYQITGIDLPSGDIRKYKTLSSVASDHNAIIHLAWNTKADNFLGEKINSENSQMFFNVYQAALEYKVPRVIVASSVHADRFYQWEKTAGYMSPYQLPHPGSPYGVHKVFMESLGSYFASKGLEVVCIRFGGINLGNKANKDHLPERAAFLSQRDCISLIRSILEAESVPNNFAIVYGVSDNNNRIHDITNPFGWIPQDKTEDFLD